MPKYFTTVFNKEKDSFSSVALYFCLKNSVSDLLNVGFNLAWSVKYINKKYEKASIASLH